MVTASLKIQHPFNEFIINAETIVTYVTMSDGGVVQFMFF